MDLPRSRGGSLKRPYTICALRLTSGLALPLPGALFPQLCTSPPSGQDSQVPFTGRPSNPDLRSVSPSLLHFFSWHLTTT